MQALYLSIFLCFLRFLFGSGCLWLSGISRSIAYNWSRPNMKIGVRIIHATSSYRNIPVSRKGRSPGFLFYRKKRRSPGFLFNRKKRRKKPRFCVQQEEAQVFFLLS
eukprot:XP_025982871.1 uncharacterized protein LOC106797433 [Glycine max]